MGSDGLKSDLKKMSDIKVTSPACSSMTVEELWNEFRCNITQAMDDSNHPIQDELKET